MGNRVVKLNCKLEREIGNHLMTEFLTCRIINDANIQIFRNMDDKPKIEDIKKVANISIDQINRTDKPLTKVDLMAILIKINPIYKNNCYDLSKVLSVKDLNYIIRSEVYCNSIEEMNNTNFELKD
jgi:hypothetical protein